VDSRHSSVSAVFEMPIFTMEFYGQFLSGFWVYLIDQQFLPFLTFFMIAYFIWAVFYKIGFKKFLEQDLSLPLIYLIFLCTSVVAGRVGFNNLDITISAKYFVFTRSLWILSIYLLMNAKLIKTLPTMVLFIPLFSYFVVGYTAQAGGMRDTQKQLSQGMADALFKGDYSKLRHPRKDEANSLLETALELDLYSPQLLTSTRFNSSVDQSEPAQSKDFLQSYSVKHAYDYVVVEFELKEKLGATPIVSFQKDVSSKKESYLAERLMWNWGKNGHRVIFETGNQKNLKSSNFALIVDGNRISLDNTL